jgi:orotate phosphoribosyltransferase
VYSPEENVLEMKEPLATEVARLLLQINAIKVQPSNPFTWASGWKSPIYCDNRKILSFPDARLFIRDQFHKVISARFPEAEVIAGVATGAIAHGVLVAEKMGLPFIYVRSEAKSHGLENLIEGVLEKGQKVVVIEDLISTGNSSLRAAMAVKNQGGTVLGMAAIFTYEFEQAALQFTSSGIDLVPLSCYSALIEEAMARGTITGEQLQDLRRWRLNPSEWGR